MLWGLLLALPLLWELKWFVPFWIITLVAQITVYRWHRGINASTAFILFLVTALCYALFPCDDDVWRYLFEARAFDSGHNPYLTAPANLQHLDSTGVNHPSWTAIYGPLFILVLAWFEGWVNSPFTLCLFWSALHLLNSIILRKVAPEGMWKLHLLSPFLLFETIAHGHMEVFLTLGLLVWVMAEKARSPALGILGFLLCLWIKWWGWLLFPLFLKRRNLTVILVTLAVSVLVLWPFREAPWALLTSVLNFQELWTNGYPHLWIEELFGPLAGILMAMTLLALLLAVVLVGGPFHEQVWQFLRLGLWLAPTLHPWYWVLPLTALLLSGKSLSFSLMGAAAVGLHYPEFALAAHGEWTSSFWTVLPLLLLTFLSEWRQRRYLAFEEGESFTGVSVVTPVFNEAENLDRLGQRLEGIPEVKDWIVVDGGSEDESFALAQAKGARALAAQQKGRGNQILEGVRACSKDWVLVVHADSDFSPSFFRDLRQTVERVPGLVGGAFRMVYNDHTRMGPLMFLNDLKTRWLGISFGDQCQFLHRKRLEALGGFPALPLMEDLELSLLWKGEPVAYIDRSNSITSPRRWHQVGRLKNAKLIIKLLWIYLWQRHWSPPVDVRRLYQRYYP